MSLHVLVLAGGGGTRLWPLSRSATPKHLLPLGPDGATLLRSSVERVLDLGDTVSVVTAAEQAGACEAALAGLVGAEAIIAEPVARGTGPALGLATALVSRADPDAVIASVHADSAVGDDGAYRAAVLASAGWALGTGGLATVGLAPSSPATGYGYIELGSPADPGAWRPPATGQRELVAAAAALPAFTAVRLVEKPDPETARTYAGDGRHLWNLGLFAWRARVFLDELRAADATLAAGVERTAQARAAGDENAAAASYSALRSVAVEPLVFERTARLICVRASFPWSDLGSWGDLHAARVAAGRADSDGNVVSGDVAVVQSSDCTVESRSGRLVAVVGAQGLVVIDTPGAVLVVPQDQSQLVKAIVERLRAEGRTDLL